MYIPLLAAISVATYINDPIKSIEETFFRVEELGIDIINLDDGIVTKKSGTPLEGSEKRLIFDYVEMLHTVLQTTSTQLIKQEILSTSHYYVMAVILLSTSNKAKYIDYLFAIYNRYIYEQNLRKSYLYIDALEHTVSTLIQSKELNEYDKTEIISFLDQPAVLLHTSVMRSIDDLYFECMKTRCITVSNTQRQDTKKLKIILSKIKCIDYCELVGLNVLYNLVAQYVSNLSSAYQRTHLFLECLHRTILPLYCEQYAKILAIKFNLHFYDQPCDIRDIQSYTTASTTTTVSFRAVPCPKHDMTCVSISVLPQLDVYHYMFPLLCSN